MKFRQTILLSVFFLSINDLIACASETLPNHNEIVMSEGMKITAETEHGKIIIIAGARLYRSYTWKGGTRSVIMLPRKKRWLGSLGLYYPGQGNHWKEHDGITRGVLEEGYQNFSSIDEGYAWISKKVHWSAVYQDDGLLVNFHKSKEAGGTLHVGVWQVLINGEKPQNLAGSKNNKLITW